MCNWGGSTRQQNSNVSNTDWSSQQQQQYQQQQQQAYQNYQQQQQAYQNFQANAYQNQQNTAFNQQANTAYGSNTASQMRGGYSQNSLENTTGSYAQNSLANTIQNMLSQGSYSGTTGPTEAAKELIARGTQPITSAQLAQYMNPYQQQVIDATLAQLAQQYGQQQQALKGNAISMGALGGDRARIAQAALMGEQGRNTASTLAGLESQGYQTALAAAQAEAARYLQAAGLSGTVVSGTNQQTGQTTGQTTEQAYGTNQSQTAGQATGTNWADTQAATQGYSDTATSGASQTTGSGTGVTAGYGTSAGTTTGSGTSTGTATGESSGTASGTAHTGGYGTTDSQNNPGWTGFFGMLASGGRVHRDAGGLVMGVPPWAVGAPPPQQVQQPQQGQPQKKGGGLMKTGQNLWNQFSNGMDSIQGSMMSGAGEGAGAGLGEAGAGAGEGVSAGVGEAGAGIGEAAGATGAAAGAGASTAAGAASGAASGAGAAVGEAAGSAGEGIGALLALLLARGGAAHQPTHLQKLGSHARNGLGAMMSRPHYGCGGTATSPNQAPAGGIGGTSATYGPQSSSPVGGLGGAPTGPMMSGTVASQQGNAGTPAQGPIGGSQPVSPNPVGGCGGNANATSQSPAGGIGGSIAPYLSSLLSANSSAANQPSGGGNAVGQTATSQQNPIGGNQPSYPIQYVPNGSATAPGQPLTGGCGGTATAPSQNVAGGFGNASSGPMMSGTATYQGGYPNQNTASPRYASLNDAMQAYRSRMGQPMAVPIGNGIPQMQPYMSRWNQPRGGCGGMAMQRQPYGFGAMRSSGGRAHYDDGGAVDPYLLYADNAADLPIEEKPSDWEKPLYERIQAPWNAIPNTEGETWRTRPLLDTMVKPTTIPEAEAFNPNTAPFASGLQPSTNNAPSAQGLSALRQGVFQPGQPAPADLYGQEKLVPPPAPRTGWQAVPEDLQSSVRPVSTFRVNPDGSTAPWSQPAPAPEGASNVVDQGLGAMNAQPAPVGAANLAEPGFEQIAPDRPMNHALTLADTAREGGASESAIRGLLANVQDESGFNPSLRHPDQPKFTGEAHYAHGLFQEGGEEWNKYEAWLKKNYPDSSWEDSRLQTKFLVQNLKENYPNTWEKMNKGTPEEAAQIFLNEYLKPSEKYRTAREEKYGKGVLGIEDYTNAPSTVRTTDQQGLGAMRRPEPPARQAAAPTQAPAGPSGLLGGLLGRQTGNVQPLFDPRGGAIGALLRGEAPPEPGPGEQRGGLLKRVLGINFNPLGLSDNERAALMAYGFGGVNGPALAAQTYSGLRGQDIQAQQHGAELALRAQQLMQGYAEPKIIGETYDQNTGQWHKQYGMFNPQTNRYEPTAQAQVAPGQTSGVRSVDDIAPELSGDAFISEAKKSGYSPDILSTAQRVAYYKADPKKLASMKGDQRAIIDRLASRINPDYGDYKYAAVADAEKKLATGDVAKSLRSVGRLADEVFQAHDLAGKTGNTRSETINQISGAIYPSGSQYGISRAKLGTSLNNVYDSASAVAKGGGTSAEGDVKRRAAVMNKDMDAMALQGGLETELEVGLKNGQSNLTSWNNAHGYAPDNPKYKTILEQMTPAQQQKAIELLGADKIEEITGRPLTTRTPAAASLNRMNKGYAIGTVRNGYRYKGGDPTKQESWEKENG